MTATIVPPGCDDPISNTGAGSASVPFTIPGGKPKQEAGATTACVNSMDISFGVGRFSNALWLKASNLNSASVARGALKFIPVNGDQVIYSGGELFQIENADGLTQIVPNVSGFGFTVAFYRIGQYVAIPNGYTVTGTPYVTWVLSDPGNAGNGNPRALLTENRGAVSTPRYYFTYGPLTNAWEMERPGEGNVSLVRTAGANPGDYTLLRTVSEIRGGQSVLTEETEEVYANDRMVSKRIGPVSGGELTTWTYDVNGNIESVESSNGYWELHFQMNRALPGNDPVMWDVVMSPVKDQVKPGSIPVVSSPGAITEGRLKLSHPIENGVATEMYVNGQLVGAMSTDYWTQSDGAPLPYPTQCTRVYSQIDSNGASTATIRRAYSSAPTVPSYLAGRLCATSDSATGRSTTVLHELGTLATNGDFTVNPSQPDYVCETTEELLDGMASPYQTSKSVRVCTLGGRTLVTEKHMCVANLSGPTYARLSRKLFTYDIDGNLLEEKLEGRVVYTAVYDTAGNRTSDTDENGKITTYANFTSTGLSQTQTHVGYAGAGIDAPAQPNVVTALTYDSRGRELSRSSTAGGQVIASATVYDTAGRVLSETRGGATYTFAYGNAIGGGAKVTKTLPGGITEVTEYFRDGRTHTVLGTGVLPVSYDYGIDNLGNGLDGVQWTKVTSGVDIWEKGTRDWRGLTIRNESPCADGVNTGVVRASIYDIRGRLTEERINDDPTPTRIISYNQNGEVNRVETRALSATESVTLIQTVTFEQEGGQWFSVNTVTTPDTTLRKKTRKQVSSDWLDVTGAGFGLRIGYQDELNEAGDFTSTSIYVDRTAKLLRQRTNVSSATWISESLSRNGRLESYRAPNATSSSVNMYDGLGRLSSVRDPRTGFETQITYDASYPEQSASETLTVPAGADPAAGQSKTVTQTYYANNTPNAGRVYSRNENGSVTYISYNVLGQTEKIWGDTYPTWIEYDGNGRQWKLHTYRTDPGAGTSAWPVGSLTTSNYAPGTALLVEKKDANNQATVYTYNARNQMATRVWARGVVTTYDANWRDQIVGITYNDGVTPSVMLSNPDALGRYTTVADGAGVRAISYGTRGTATSESYDVNSGGWLAGWEISRGEGFWGRQESAVLKNNGITVASTTYGYSGLSDRLDNVSSGNLTAIYGYLSNSENVETVNLKDGGANRMGVARVQDGLNRLSSLETRNASNDLLVRAGYTYDSKGRRTVLKEADNNQWEYGYDSRNQVTSAQKKQTAGGANILGYGYGYAFDAIGNRTSGMVNGRTSLWTPNDLNQLVSREVPGAVDVLGEAHLAGGAVASLVRISGGAPFVSGQVPSRLGALFYKELSVNNSSAPQHAPVEARVFAPGQGGPDHVQAETQQVYVPRTPEAFTYDADGSMTSDGRWQYTWDGENRLVVMEPLLNGTVPATARWRITNDYDGQSRRIRTQIEAWNGSSWLITRARVFLWDGWNLMAEAEATTGALVGKYVWGLDMAGSLQGAGGIGGLLWEELKDGNGVWQKAFPAYDGSGNVRKLYDTATMSTQATYEYGPFGEVVRAEGALAALNPWRYSTKYSDEEAGLVVYQLRAYSPALGRWLSRDPIAERGGLNLYGMVGNQPTGRNDVLGLIEWKKECPQGFAVKTSPGTDPMEGQSVYTDLGKESYWNLIGPDTVDERRGTLTNFRWEQVKIGNSARISAPCGAQLNLTVAYTIAETTQITGQLSGKKGIGGVDVTVQFGTTLKSTAEGQSLGGGTTIPGEKCKLRTGIMYVLVADAIYQVRRGTAADVGTKPWMPDEEKAAPELRQKVYIEVNWLVCERECQEKDPGK